MTMKNLEQRVREIAATYNPGNVDELTRLVMDSNRVRRAKKFGFELSDDDIHDEVYYYEEEYNGDCFEQACFGDPFDNETDC